MHRLIVKAAARDDADRLRRILARNPHTCGGGHPIYRIRTGLFSLARQSMRAAYIDRIQTDGIAV